MNKISDSKARLQELWTPYRFARSTARGQGVSSGTFEKIRACWVCQTTAVKIFRSVEDVSSPS
jgi:hypothetical protein